MARGLLISGNSSFFPCPCSLSIAEQIKLPFRGIVGKKKGPHEEIGMKVSQPGPGASAGSQDPDLCRGVC